MSFFDRYTKVEFRIIDTDGVVLASAGDSIEVEEPKDYEGTNLILTRITNQENVPRHGFNFSYGDPETPYIFIKAAGYQLIQDLYEAKGNDAQAEYQFLATDVRDNSIKADIRYYLDFNTYERSWVSGEPRIQLTVINESISYKIKSRYETVVNLLASKDMDGNSITPLVMDENYWHAKVILKESLYTGLCGKITSGSLSGLTNPTFSGAENEIFVVGFPNDKIKDDIPSINYNGEPVYFADYPVDGFFHFSAPDEGKYNISLRLFPQLQIGFDGGQVTGVTNDAVLRAYYMVGEQTLNDATLLAEWTDAGGSSKTVFNVKPDNTYVDSLQLKLKKGDNFYLFYQYEQVENNLGGNPRPRDFNFFHPSTDNEIEVVALTRPQTTLVRSIDIYDFINRTLEIISGQQNILVSDFYNTECGSQRWLTNGYQVRQYEADERPPESSMEDLIDTLYMIDGIGWGYEKIGGEVKVRMEKSDYFYNDAEILKIDSVFSYKEEIADELIINQLIFQFQDYIEEELNTLDSFTTKAEYLTPIFTNFLKMEVFCEYIADAYSIEYTRRQQFNESPTDSWKYDNNIFIVDWVEITGLKGGTSAPNRLNYLGTATISNDSIVTIPMIIPELVDLTLISWTPIGGSLTEYTVNDVSFDEVDGTTIITVDEATTQQSGATEFIFGGGFSFKRPESDQAFETVNNLISPSTTYNLRMSMKRILMKHAKWINSGLNYKEATDVVQNTFYDRNKTLETQFRSDVTCVGGDLNKILLKENEDLALSDYQNFARYFIPLRIIYEGELSFEENDYIRKALNGQSPDNNNYGYLSIKNEEGTYTKVYPNEHIFKPISGKIEGNGYKKYDTP